MFLTRDLFIQSKFRYKLINLMLCVTLKPLNTLLNSCCGGIFKTEQQVQYLACEYP